MLAHVKQVLMIFNQVMASGVRRFSHLATRPQARRKKYSKIASKDIFASTVSHGLGLQVSKANGRHTPYLGID